MSSAHNLGCWKGGEGTSMYLKKEKKEKYIFNHLKYIAIIEIHGRSVLN